MDKKSPLPILLSLIAVIFVGHALLIPAAFVMTAVADANAPLTYFGEPSRIGDHRTEMLVTMVVWWAVALAYVMGFWRRKKWLRPALAALFIAPFVLVALVSLFRLDPVLLGFGVLWSYAFWWYLFRKRSVAAYFADAE